MKKLLLILLFIATGSFNIAQEKTQSLKVNYVQNLDFDIEELLNNVPSEYRAQVKPMFEQELKDGIKMDYILKTNGKASVYQLVEKIDNSQSTGGMIAAQIAQADKEPTYKDLTNNTFKKLASYPGMEAILVVDTLPNYQWKITRETEKIAGYETRKATGSLNDSVSVTAWFAPKIPISDGPGNVAGLPGLVLKTSFESNGANVTIAANDIQIREEDIKIKEPTAKKVMTQKEFEAEIKKMVEKFKNSQGGGVSTD